MENALSTRNLVFPVLPNLISFICILADLLSVKDEQTVDMRASVLGEFFFAI